jgi:iron complex outermembrane receptor protein
MNLKHFLFLIVVAITPVLVAQVDTLKLDDVILSDVRLTRYASNSAIKILNDSVLQQQNGNTTEFLRFNTPIYFKENGFGMVSSPSFRGTTASQTAVIWNGININSSLNGQTDFNTLSLNGFDTVAIKSGGGSSMYGTGAIGGSIHLKNTLKFDKHLKNTLQLGYGSFDHQRYNYQLKAGDTTWSANVNLHYQQSDNDYKYLETNERNSNGDYNNASLNLNFGLFVSENHLLKFYNQTFRSDRNLSATLVAPSRSKYKDDSSRNLLKWTYLNMRFTSEVSLAYLYERYQFFSNKNTSNFSFGKANTLLGRYNLDYKISNKSRINGLLEYNTVQGSGTNISAPSNNTFSTAAIYKHVFNNKLDIGLEVRKEFNSEFKTPTVFSVDSRFNISKVYALSLQISKDFRTPTFNDLYWQPGGNLDLTPEVSHQFDFGQTYTYKKLTVKANVFVIDIEDMIQWRPDNSGVWSPVNVANVQSKGLELGAELTHKSLKLNGNYSYTDSRDKEKDRQLVYVPFHKFSGTFAYNYKNITAYYQQLINGEVYTNSRVLDAYQVGNIGLSYSFNTPKLGAYKFGLSVRNIFNAYYENVALRPMPNRNFNFNLTFNF